MALREWRLVGLCLAALIAALAFRSRLSRARIQEFLGEWLGLKLSIGTIHRTLHEAGAAVTPAEAGLVAEVLASGLLYADEKPWPETGQTLWLRVFVAATTTLYLAGRGKERVENGLDGFTGWLLSRCWGSYRHYPYRLRCWAHLLRKPRGMVQSGDREARVFGQRVLTTLEVLMAAVYVDREPPRPRWNCRPSTRRRWWPRALLAKRDSAQRTAHSAQPASENSCLGDGVAQRLGCYLPGVVASEMPLDEQRDRTRPAPLGDPAQAQSGHSHLGGLTVFALLASVIDTCRQRGHAPWRTLELAITDRRAGLSLASLTSVERNERLHET